MMLEEEMDRLYDEDNIPICQFNGTRIIVGMLGLTIIFAIAFGYILSGW